MKIISLIGALFLLLGSCGGDEAPDNTGPQKVPLYEPPCLNCNMDIEDEEEFVIPPPTPHVYATPPELMFYFSNNTPYPYPPGSVHVCNATPSTVVVTDAHVIGEEGSMFSNPSYFELLENDLPQQLASEECLTLQVNFLFSTYQRSALLEIFTTYPSNATIYVSLSGKVFLFF